MAPNPRTAFGLAVQPTKKRAIMFGGILDQEGKVGAVAQPASTRAPVGMPSALPA